MIIKAQDEQLGFTYRYRGRCRRNTRRRWREKTGTEVQGMTFSGIADVSALYKRRRRNPGHVWRFFAATVGAVPTRSRCQNRCSTNKPTVAGRARESAAQRMRSSPGYEEVNLISAAGRNAAGLPIKCSLVPFLRLLVPVWGGSSWRFYSLWRAAETLDTRRSKRPAMIAQFHLIAAPSLTDHPLRLLHATRAQNARARTHTHTLYLSILHTSTHAPEVSRAGLPGRSVLTRVRLQ